MKKAFVVYSFLACSLFSCIKPPTYANLPQIEFKSVSTINARSGFPDTIVFSFTDGAGDITTSAPSADTITNTCGLQHGDSSILHLAPFNIFLIDGRDSCISTYASANIQSTGKYQGLSGTIQVIVPISTTKCYCPCSQLDTVTYAIILRDGQGHLSNTIHMPPISIRCN